MGGGGPPVQAPYAPVVVSGPQGWSTAPLSCSVVAPAGRVVSLMVQGVKLQTNDTLSLLRPGSNCGDPAALTGSVVQVNGDRSVATVGDLTVPSGMYAVCYHNGASWTVLKPMLQVGLSSGDPITFTSGLPQQSIEGWDTTLKAVLANRLALAPSLIHLESANNRSDGLTDVTYHVDEAPSDSKQNSWAAASATSPSDCSECPSSDLVLVSRPSDSAPGWAWAFTLALLVCCCLCVAGALAFVLTRSGSSHKSAAGDDLCVPLAPAGREVSMVELGTVGQGTYPGGAYGDGGLSTPPVQEDYGYVPSGASAIDPAPPTGGTAL
eukprot:NODE_835_length_1141_cov_85.638278_g678_i0.p3 GENE.NODE_835_length_1141_cov_85.638278_g678_i0~~NODE_835_length_1141_cov_85.638278_g678_i0.p3  ORF type:complete len:323 (-),score=103.55 NODE_835_length_1141_cov_85.638278_g678_i0:145-1113(-)